MKPSVGRIVQYHHRSGDGRTPDTAPRAAIVTAVHADGRVNLHVFDHGLSPPGIAGMARNVREGDPAAETKESIWCWPPRVIEPDQLAAYPQGAPPIEPPAQSPEAAATAPAATAPAATSEST